MDLTKLPESVQVKARKRYLEDYQRIVTSPWGVTPPNFADYLAEEYDRAFLHAHGVEYKEAA